MTIVRNLEQQSSNWTEGTVGSGSIVRGNSDTSAAMNREDGLSGINRRTLTLSNGEVIWDLAGNVWEWTDNTILGSNKPTPAGEYTNLTSFGALSPERFLPTNSAWNSTQGYGIFGRGTLDETIYVFIRGGYYGDSTNAGILALDLGYEASSTSASIGFRCAR